MMIAQITAVVLGALVVTTEYGTGMIRSTFAAVPSRGRVLAAKAVVVTAVLFVVGTVTALVGYFGGNYFLDREGIGMALEGDVLRAMYGSGLYLAGIGLFTVAVGFLLRHTAGTISIVLALMLILGNMVMLVPGDVRRLAGEADARQRRRVDRHPGVVQPEPARTVGPGTAVFCIETADPPGPGLGPGPAPGRLTLAGASAPRHTVPT